MDKMFISKRGRVTSRIIGEFVIDNITEEPYLCMRAELFEEDGASVEREIQLDKNLNNDIRIIAAVEEMMSELKSKSSHENPSL